MFNLGNASKSFLAKKEELNKYSIDNYDCDLENENDSHSIVINNIKLSDDILDVGCGVGFIGKKIKQIKKCHIEGIEIDEEASKIATNYYDKIYHFSLEDMTNDDTKKFYNNKKKYDCIILADIIEHLKNPGEIIAKLVKKLDTDGVMLISIPNIAHIDIVSNLINGNFNYNSTGIIDSTHLRFFTENSFYDFIDNINENYNINLSASLIGKTYAKEEDLNDAFLVDELANEAYVFQNIFEVFNNKNKKVNRRNRNSYANINKRYLEMKKNIGDLEKNNGYLKEELKCYKNKYSEIEKKTKEYELKIQQIQNQLNNTNEELNRVYNSKSWRMTAPIRKIKFIINNMRSK